MTVRINGEPREITRATNVRELLSELGLVPHALLVEHNGVALRREEWESRSLAADDRIEIIRIVAGG